MMEEERGPGGESFCCRGHLWNSRCQSGLLAYVADRCTLMGRGVAKAVPLLGGHVRETFVLVEQLPDITVKQ